jgi:hypothetical protein
VDGRGAGAARAPSFAFSRSEGGSSAEGGVGGTRVHACVGAVVAATIDIYTNITKQMLPTPAKSHYTFNLRDLSKVFQGMAQCPAEAITKKEQVGKARAARCQGPCAPCANPNPPPPNKRVNSRLGALSQFALCSLPCFPCALCPWACCWPVAYWPLVFGLWPLALGLLWASSLWHVALEFCLLAIEPWALGIGCAPSVFVLGLCFALVLWTLALGPSWPLAIAHLALGLGLWTLALGPWPCDTLPFALCWCPKCPLCCFCEKKCPWPLAPRTLALALLASGPWPVAMFWPLVVFSIGHLTLWPLWHCGIVPCCIGP